jgi:thiol-disulfide isomerase/thioredoxin
MIRSSSLFACGAAVLAIAAATCPAWANPAAAVQSGEAVLLDFSAAWCGPCRQMAPLIGEIAAAGWVVRHVDVDRELDVVRRFGVSGVPCYIMLVKGQEVGRINGATTRGELEQLLAKASAPLGGAAPTATAAAVTQAQQPAAGMPLPGGQAAAPLATEPPSRSRTPAAALAATPIVTPPPAALPPARPTPAPGREPAAPLAAAARLPADARAALEQRLLAATARLKVEDAQGSSWGTGTVVDCRQGEALILTCGHIFRDSQGAGRIEVDCFAPGGPRGVAGQVVSWDLKRDLALVSIFTDAALVPVRVGGTDRGTKAGESVVTVGCNGGADPTIHHSQITAVDKYLGPANVQVAGQPVQGRSGGGLFAVDGTLIGVCNAADPADNEGLFAALPTIHEQLEEAGLAFVYRNVYPSGGLDGMPLAGPGGSAHVPAMPAEMPAVAFDRRDRAGALPTASTAPAGERALPPAAVAPAAPLAAAAQAAMAAPVAMSSGERALIDHVRQHGGRAEVICIVRPQGAAESASEVYVLKDSSREFVDHLATAHRGAAQAAGHGHHDRAGRSDVAALPPANPVR